MEAPWRWTSSVFLVLALSIGNTLSQNVGPNCLLPPHSELVNPRKINNVFFYPPNGLASGGPAAPVLESPRQAFQDRLCTQCPLNQQAQQACQCNERTDIVPISQISFTNVSPLNAQSACADPGLVSNIQEPLFPFPQPTPQNQLPAGPPTCLPQQNVGLPQLEIISQQVPLIPFSKRMFPSPSLCSQIESASYPNGISYQNNHFTPFDPVAQPELPVTGPVYNIPGPLFPFPQPTPQNQLPVGSPTYFPQQNVGLPQLEIFPPQDPLVPFSKRTLPSPPLCSQLELTSYPNGISYQNNHFTPFDPVAQPELPVPSKDVIPPRRDALLLSSSLPQSTSRPSFTQIIPLNNQETLVDAYAPGPTQCHSLLNGSPTNTFLSVPSKLPIQEPIPPYPQINSLPQSLGFQCNFLPETSACPTPSALPSPIGAKLQSSLTPSPFNMFSFPRPTIFQPSYSPCDLNTNTADQASVCANPALIEKKSICPQVPTAPTAFMPNILPELLYQNSEQFPLHSLPVSQPLLNSGPCSFTPDVASINSLPPTFITQPCGIPSNGFGCVLTPQVTNIVDYSTTPLNLFPTCVPTSPPILSNPINRPYNSDISGLCESSVPDTVPVPINLQINVPPPVIPAPTITIINTAPIPDDTVSNNNEGLIDYPNPMPPMIVEGRRSRSRTWLPLILMALFAGDGDFGGCGGGCSCDSGAIPIPYPIPIPTNNPIVVSE